MDPYEEIECRLLKTRTKASAKKKKPKAVNIPAEEPLGRNIQGIVVFANGNICNIYRVDKGNIKNLNTFEAGSRAEYVAAIAEYLQGLQGAIYLFGSREIAGLLVKKCASVRYKGFLDFNNTTINDRKRWLPALKEQQPDDSLLRIAAHYLATDVDYLDFDKSNATARTAPTTPPCSTLTTLASSTTKIE